MSTAEFVEQLTDLYDQYRTALLNRKYYGTRLERIKRLNAGLEISIAVGTSSTVGGWIWWQEQTGVLIWNIIAALAVILAIIKPILRLSTQVERYCKLFTGHSAVLYDFDALIREARVTRTFTPDMQRAFTAAMDRVRVLAPQDDPVPKKSLLESCYDQVNSELPPGSLWLPSEVSQ